MKTVRIVISVLVIATLVLGISAAIVTANIDEQERWDGYSYMPQSWGADYDYKYFKDRVKHDKAMILIPGLMASTFISPYDGEPTWGLNGFINLATAAVNIPDKEEAIDYVLNHLKCDENNLPVLKQKIANMSTKGADPYGSFNGMKYIYDELKLLGYGEDYDIVVWQYDWRQNNKGSAKELEKFINYNGWNEVAFFTHSMGGVVVSNYLSLSQSNRDKTSLFVPAGCPFFGSMDAVNNLFIEQNPGGMMQTIFSSLEKSFGRSISLYEIARTLGSVYELLPFGPYETLGYFVENSGVYTGETSATTYEGLSVTSNQFLEILKGMEWTKRKDGTNIPALNVMADYRSSLFIETDEGYKFVADLVNTVYIVGTSMNTAVAARINADGTIDEKIYSQYGDGTVAVYSATAGHALTDENVYIVEGIAHGPLLDNYVFTHKKEETGLRYIKEILEKFLK